MPVKFEDIRLKIENGDYTLAANGKSTRSTVWHVYRKIEKEDGTILDDVLYCIGCKGLKSFTHKSTTNLRRHRCHMQYLKEQRHCGLGALSSGAKDWYKTVDDAEISVENSLVEAELKTDEDADDGVDDEILGDDIDDIDQSLMEDLMEKKHSSTDGGVYSMDTAASVSTILRSQPPCSHNADPLNVSSVSSVAKPVVNTPATSTNSHLWDINGVDESSIYAQTWSLEYRKLSEDQKFFAKRAIDEIFVLGRLRRLTLNTVPPAE
ncbi:uncharacterized protein [Drosophila tropicalis]|uniref:uncharacterized protein n=1 Tax=Drosophila tropicalis TaxID=46794 RepID=UPI0035AB971D